MLYFSPWKTVSILAAVLIGLIFAAPNLLSDEVRESLPSWVPNQAMTLGLDLQGGSHILMKVDRAALIAEKQATLEDDIRSTLREAKIGYRMAKSGETAVNVTLREESQLAAAQEALEPLTAPICWVTRISPSYMRTSSHLPLPLVALAVAAQLAASMRLAPEAAEA